MNKFTLAQFFGLLGSISMLLSMWQKTRKKVLTFLLLDSLFYSMQYILLGAFSGAFTNIVGLVRTLIFRNKEKHTNFQNKTILYITITLYIIVGILTYNGLPSIFPVVASILYSVVLWQNNVKHIRIGTAVMMLAWFIYNISVNAYIAAVVELVLLTSSIIAIIKLDNSRYHSKTDLVD